MKEDAPSAASAVATAIGKSPRLYDVFLLLDVLHVYDPLGVARVRVIDNGARIVFDGPAPEDLDRLDRQLMSTIPAFIYDEMQGGWCYHPGAAAAVDEA